MRTWTATATADAQPAAILEPKWRTAKPVAP